MANPLEPQSGLDIQFNEEEKKALDNYLASFQTQENIPGFMATPSPFLPQAQNLIQLRDDPQAIDFIGGTFERLRQGQLPFNSRSWKDAVSNVENYTQEIAPRLNEAQQKGDWLGATKLALGGVGKTLAAYLQAGFGATNKQLEKAQQSLAAENYIGKIKAPEKAATALELGQLYTDELAEGKSIIPKGQAPAASFGTGPWTAKLGMNLSRAEEYLRDLQSDRSKTLGTAALRNFAIQSGDAFLPFVSIGDVIIDDETNPDLVARRGALINAINDTIHRDYGVSTLAGAATGSVGSFIGVGLGATKALGTAAQLADKTVKLPSVLSRGATYATIGAAQSFEGDPRNLTIPQRLASVFSEASIMGLSEGVGNKLEGVIDQAVANHVAAKALSVNYPALVPLVGSTGKVLATTIGETTSEEIEAILRGQDPVQPFLANLGVSFGIGVGMALPSAAVLAARRAKIYKLAEDNFAKSLEQTVKGIKTDPNISEEQKQEQLNNLRSSLTAPQAQNLFDAVNIRAGVNPTVAPETYKVATEVVEKAKPGTVEAMLQQKIQEAEGKVTPEGAVQVPFMITRAMEQRLRGLNYTQEEINKLTPQQANDILSKTQIGKQPVMETKAPESEEDINRAFNELTAAFQNGAEEIRLQSTPQNQAKIDWLEQQGRVYGELAEDKSAYVIRGVKDAEGNWLGTEDPMEILQDEKDAIIQEIETRGLAEEQLNQITDELEKATNLDQIETIASRVLGPTEFQTALETRLAQQQERVAEEKPAELRAKKIQSQIEGLQKRITQSPVEEQPALEEQLGNLRQLLQQEQAGRAVRGEETVANLIRQYERDTDAALKSGKVSPLVEERPEVVLAMNNPQNASYQKFLKLPPDARENDPESLPSVFNLKNSATVELLQSLGAIDENGRNILSPAETLVEYVQRKNEYLRSKSLSGYQGLNIADEVSSATTNKFLYELRQGKSDISLSTIFNSQLRNFIEAARPRMRAGIGIGAATQLEEGRTQALSDEALAEDQGLNPALAGTINETLGQIDATELEVQAERMTDVPSPAQRQEALSVIAKNMQGEFKNSLKTDAEKLAFDTLFTGKKDVAQAARAINTTVDNINALQPVVREKFVSELEKRYRRAEELGSLPAREVQVAPEAVREGNLSPAQIQPAVSKFRRLKDQDYFDEQEQAEAQKLLSRVQSTRQADSLKKFDDYVNGVVIAKLDPNSIEELAMQVATNLQNAEEDGRISKAEAAKYRDQLTKLESQYLKSEELEDVAQQYKVAGEYRSNLLRANDQLMRDAGYTINEEGAYEDIATEEEAKPKLETPIDRRAAARERLAQIQAERAASARGVPEKAVQPVGPQVGRTVERPPTGGGRPGVARVRGTPVDKSFVKPRSQIGKPYNESSVNSLGKAVTQNLDTEQRQDVAAAISSLQGSRTESFYLANGPGTGKTRVLLATAKYYLDRGYNVFYLTAPDAVTPDWRSGTIGGSIQKDAALMGIPLTARGSTARGTEGLPITKVPGQVVATTYTSQYLEQVLEKVDKNTVVIFDEQHSGRNLHKAIQEGKTRAWSVLMDQISAKAGKVLMASGTPFETPAQLLSLGRLGIFDTESPDALLKRLGFERKYLPGGRKSYWDLVPGITETQMQERLEAYLDSLSSLGIMRSRSLKLDGVNVEFQDVALTPEINRKLQDLTDMYGGFQNSNISARRKLVAAHKRALEEHKVPAAAERAIDAIRRGKKPVIYVGFVSEETAKGDIVDPTSAQIEAELVRRKPDLRVARMYTGSDQTKEQAMAAFNEGDADVLIATKEMGGTGIELDDKFGDEAREMIVLAPPVSAIQAVQLVYRVWRVDSASRPTVVFMESQAEVDQMSLDRMRAKLLLLDATMGAGFEGLKAEGVAEEKVFSGKEADMARVPVYRDLFNKGWSLIPEGSGKEYKDKAGNIYTTLEKQGVRLAINPNAALLEKRGEVLNAIGSGTDVTVEFIGMSKEKRAEGLSKGAFLLRGFRELTDIADNNGLTLFTFPVQLEEDGLTAQQLTALYERHGFELGSRTQVLVRKPKTVIEKPKAVPNETKIIAPEPTAAQISEVEKDIAESFGKDYSNGVISLRDAKGEAKSYNVQFSNQIENLAHAMIGNENETDVIVFNPNKIAKAKTDLGKGFKSYFTKVLIEESIHVETFRYFRELQLNPIEELTAIGEGMSQAARLAVARLYHSGLGSDITDAKVQGKIKALASDPYLVATEAIRQIAQLDFSGGITEQVVGVSRADLARANARLRDTLAGEPKPTLARIGVWFDSMVSAVKKGLGLAPSAVDRLAMRQSIEDAVDRLRKNATYFTKASQPTPAPAISPDASPIAVRPATRFDSYDLRVYRMIENHLEGRVDGVLGVTAIDGEVSADEWLDALDVASRRGLITKAERNLYRSAAKASLNNGKINLYETMNESLRIAEELENTGQSLPVEALVPTTSQVEDVVTAEETGAPEPVYRPYRVKIGVYPAEPTTAPSAAKAASNIASRLLSRQEVVVFNGKNYTRGSLGALVAAMRDYGYDRIARPLQAPAPESTRPIVLSVSATGEPTVIAVPAAAPAPAPAAEPVIRESKAIKNIVTAFIDRLPDSAIKDTLLDKWYYQSVPREQQFEDAREYISANGLDSSLQAFLSGNIKSSLPLQGAIGFELARALGEKAKTDRFAREQLAEVMLLVGQKYGTDPGRTIDLWNSLADMAEIPEVLKYYITKQIDNAIKGRLSGLAEEENEIKIGLQEASRRATDKLPTSPKAQKTLEQLTKLIELNKRKASIEEFDKALSDYLNSSEATSAAAEFLGADLGVGAPEPGASEADEIRLDPNQTKALGRLITEIIQRSEDPKVTAASPDEIKRLIMLVPALKDARNQDNVRRKLDLYFDASLAFALESFTARALKDARARAAAEQRITPPATRGEAKQRASKAKRQAEDEAPVAVQADAPSRLAALADAAADALQRQAEKLQEEPKQKDALEEFAIRIRRLISQRTKEMGGLQPVFQPEPKPSEAEMLRDRIAKYPEVQEFIDNVRDSLKNNFKEEELIGLEPFIEEAFGRPFTVSGLKRAVRSLESIGGPQTNIRGLIRSSKGDIMDFENKLGAALTVGTNLNEAEKKQVLDFLREGVTELIAQERKAELEKIKAKFEKNKERKTRKVRSALDKLIEAVNLGVLTDSEIFAQMHSQLGLPELKEAERIKLNKMIEDLPLYPKGMIRNKKISEMYQYVKLVAPQTWGDLIVNYQTSNLLAGIGTIGINAWSAAFTNLTNGVLLAGIGAASMEPAKRKAYISAFGAQLESIFKGNKPATKALKNVLLKGDYSNIQDALSMELNGVPLWETILAQAEAYREGKPEAAKPELPVKILGQEHRIPLDSKYLSSKYGAMAPFIWFGRAMAAGDALNKISSKKMYEMAEAANIAISKGLKSQEEIELEVARLLNQTPEARRRAEAKAEAEAKEFNLTSDQQGLRVEEILEQGRPEEAEVQQLMERAKKFAAQTTFTNDFEGWFGMLADGLTSWSTKAWPLRLVIKFLRTGSSIANETLNFMPVISTVRIIRGSAAMLKDSKYYRPPPTPGTVEHDLLLAKQSLGYGVFGVLMYVLREAMGGEDDPEFMVHFKGPIDPAQRDAFFAAGGKLRSIQWGRFKDGAPRFLSFESFPVGLIGPLIMAGAITEAVRYEKRAKAETFAASLIAGPALAMYGIMDMAALSGIRQLLSLTSPGVGKRDPSGILSDIVKVAGNVAGGLIPGYATLRDVEQIFNSMTNSPTTRPYKQNLLATFFQSVPFASKVGEPDLNFLGDTVKTDLANAAPFIRRLTTTGVDSNKYDTGDRSQQAIHDKLLSLFASNRTSLDWEAGPLKDFAMQELVQQAAANGESLTYDDFFELRRELTPEEKYEWLKRAGPAIQQQLAPLIPTLENADRATFITIVRAVANPTKRATLYQILAEKNQENILLKGKP